MAITAAAVKAALAALTDEQARKTVGWIAAAVLAPIILIAALLTARCRKKWLAKECRGQQSLG